MRFHRDQRRAYEAVLRQMPSISMDADDEKRIVQKLAVLKTAIDEINIPSEK